MAYKTMYGVEYQYIDEKNSFDIFENYEKAVDYVKMLLKTKEPQPLNIFKANFNEEYIYFDEDFKGWNYDEYYNLISGKINIIETLEL